MAAVILLFYTKANRVERNDTQAGGLGLSRRGLDSTSKVKLEFIAAVLNIVLQVVWALGRF